MKKLLGRNKGITLIALIITIIVMLLLSGVVLNTLTGRGSIIENTNSIVKKYNNSVEQEQVELNEVSNYLDEKVKEKEPVTVADIVKDPRYYGAYVNYEVPSSGDKSVKWRIFYASSASEESDSEGHIYLIADDYIDVSKTPKGGTEGTYMSNLPTSANGAKDMKDETQTDKRIQKWQSKYLAQKTDSELSYAKASAYIVNSTNWNKYYKNTTYAEYAIGGPTLELFIASYNKTHEADLYCSSNIKGYYVSFTDGEEDTSVSGLNTKELNNLYVIDATPGSNSATRIGRAHAYWIGSPSAVDYSNVMSVDSSGNVNGYGYLYSSIRLPSGRLSKV